MPRTINRELFDFSDSREVKPAPKLLHPALKGYAPQIEQWILRALIALDGINSETTKLRQLFRRLTEVVEISPDLQGDREIFTALSNRHEQIERCKNPADGTFSANLDALGGNLQLSSVERDLLAFTVIYHHYSLLETVIDASLGRTDLSQLPYYLSRILGHSSIECESALKLESTLISTGLIEIGRHSGCARRTFNELISLHQRASKTLLSSGFTISDLLDTAVRVSFGSDLTLADYDFMAKQRDLVMGYLQAVKADDINKASILLDGPPGVGKTEFARLIAQELGFDAFEINELDEDHDAASTSERLGYFLLAQHMMKGGRRSLLIFDEADAALGAGLDLNRDRWRQSKASLNRMLDTLKVPTIWITNHGLELDPAIARRIDLTIRFDAMRSEAKLKMIQAALPNLTETPKWVHKITRHSEVTPARIDQAKRLSHLLAKGEDHAQADYFCSVISQNLGFDQDKLMAEKSLSPLCYRPEIINASEHMETITTAVGRTPQVRLCLYGPPGTGKTAYAHYLADQCGLQLAEYRASDLLGAYVGQSEANIRRMFLNCDNPETLLFLDEADSLFRSRQFATRNFEINQVNELLKGLEEYSGVFVACTNLLDELDPAVMRRFDFKVQLDYLKPNQRWVLFEELINSLNTELDESSRAALQAKLDTLHFLTPGDFAILARRGRVLDIGDDPFGLITALEKEMSVKPDSKASVGMGFTANIPA